MSKKFVVGIDLGTSNSAVAIADCDHLSSVEVIEILQTAAPHSVVEKKLLPSALYVPFEKEFGEEAFVLPWQKKTRGVVGTFARERGMLAPDRLVTSAKSWLCNQQIDRKSPILPWGGDGISSKYSPFEVTKIYLEHLAGAVLETLRKKEHGGVTLLDCEIVLAVPASFDESARALTAEAAREAGWGEVLLLEEPQAAFYAWIDANTSWREQVNAGDIILVCDVGGGTADFSLIAVDADSDGMLALQRISVGDHILLGGENMDLALAHALRVQLEGEGHVIDQWQFLSLVQSARIGKERLLASDGPEEFPIAIPTRGASLFGKTLTTTMRREMVVEVLLEGFLPLTSAEDMPRRRNSLGLHELGLQYEADPVLSKHLAGFLTRSLKNVRSNTHLSEIVSRKFPLIALSFIIPNAILFNGGVFEAPAFRKRVLELLEDWSGGVGISELESASLSLSVARGAAAYGRVRVRGEGTKIRSGVGRSYYIGLGSSAPAVPGIRPPIKALCVVPQGMEEGSERVLENQEFGLITDEPVEFRFFSSTVRAGDTVGVVVNDAETELEETTHMEVTLHRRDAAGAMPEIVPVRLVSHVTELGMLELWMKHSRSDERWKLEFQVRDTHSQ